MNNLIQNIEQWAVERNLIEGSTPQKQMLKLMEEFGELCGGIAKNKPDVVKDSIGDCFVVLVILRQQLGITGSEHHFAELTDKFKMPARFTIELACLDFGVHYGELARNIGMIDSFGIGLYPENIVFNLIRCYGSLLAITYAQNLKIEDCVQLAYHQIKDRKGRMVDGIWVKQEDLKNDAI